MNTAVVDSPSRRTEFRFSVETSDPVVVVAPITGTITDESNSGIGLLLDDILVLRLNQEVVVSHRGASESALVKYVQRTEDGTFRVGLQWKDVGGPDGAKEAATGKENAPPVLDFARGNRDSEGV